MIYSYQGISNNFVVINHVRPTDELVIYHWGINIKISLQILTGYVTTRSYFSVFNAYTRHYAVDYWSEARSVDRVRVQGSPLIAWAGGRRGVAVTQHVDVNVEICFPCCSYVFTQRVGSVSLFCFEIKQPASPRIAINIVI